MRRSLSEKEACSPTETSPKSHKEPKEFHRRTNCSLPSVSSNIFERFRVLYRSHKIAPSQSRIYTNSYVIQQSFPRGHARRFLHSCELVTELSPLNTPSRASKISFCEIGHRKIGFCNLFSNIEVIFSSLWNND